MKQPCVYLLANHYKGTLYVGVTSNLAQRIWQHKSETVDGFTAKYGVKTLVWYAEQESMEQAIEGEKRLKKLSRSRKFGLIEQMNPEWKDLSETLE